MSESADGHFNFNEFVETEECDNFVETGECENVITLLKQKSVRV